MNGELRCLLTSMEWRSNTYKWRPKRWYPGETVSLALAKHATNFTRGSWRWPEATLTNRRSSYRLHFAKAVKNTVTGEITESHQPSGESLSCVPSSWGRNALVAVSKGTRARASSRAAHISADKASKTGTAQAVSACCRAIANT